MMPAEMLLMIYVVKSEAKYLCQGFLDPDIKDYYCCDALGKPSHTKTYEFLQFLQTAFDPSRDPPSLILHHNALWADCAVR